VNIGRRGHSLLGLVGAEIGRYAGLEGLMTGFLVCFTL
jgi:hypothetical protein